MIHISYSRASSYLSCPYKHFLSYVMGLRQKKPVRPLQFGSDFHRLLELRDDSKALREAHKQITDTFYELPSNWQDDLGRDYLEDLETIFGDYQEVYADTIRPSVTEQKFEIELGKIKGQQIVLVGIIDELYRRKDAQTKERYIKLGEHKTFSRRPDQNTLVMNTQKCIYAKAAYFLYGMLPRSVIWDYIHSRPAEEPLWLVKSKRFSNKKSTKITPQSWLRACKRHGVTDRDVIAQAEQYRDNIPNFFFRYDMDIIPTMVDNLFDGFLYTARQIVLQGEKNRTKNVTQNCAWCEFKDICYTELTGGSLSHILDNDFIIKDSIEAVDIGGDGSVG